MNLQTLADEIERLDSLISVIHGELDHLKTGKGTWVSGKPYGPVETQRLIKTTTSQLETYQALRNTIAAMMK